MEDIYCYYCMSHRTEDESCPVCGKTTECNVPDYHLKPGTVLRDKYLIGKAIGEGGFGITYIGRDLTLDMRVAVKEYYPHGVSNRNNERSNYVTMSERSREASEKEMQRFLNEARTLARFSDNPGVVSVRDFFKDNGTAYIVMEYLDGITLKSYLGKYGHIPPKELAEMLDPVLQALHGIHKQGLIHRDISPDNIMLLKDGRLKLLDFGAARYVGEGRTLSVVLKPGYAPEEQYRSKGDQGPWTDVYAICATIYKCITGITPDESIQRVFKDELKKPSELGIDIPREYEQALMQGLAVKSTDRIQSVDALRRALSKKGEDGCQGTIDGTGTSFVPVESVALEPELSRRSRRSIEVRSQTTGNRSRSRSSRGAHESTPRHEVRRQEAAPSNGRAQKSKRSSGIIIATVGIIAALIVCLTLVLGGKSNVSPTEDGKATTVAVETSAPISESQSDSVADDPDNDSRAQYSQAELLLANGDKAGAAIAFGKIADYKDARERSFALWDEVADRSSLSAGYWYTVGLKADGTVVATGRDDEGQCNVSDWADIVAVSAGYWHTVGVKTSGAVVAAGINTAGQCEVSEWSGIIDVAAGGNHTVGLKADGTVVAAGTNGNWQCNVSDWTEIVAVSAGWAHTVGLRADGTVVAVGNNYYGQCEVSEWTGIVAISTGRYHTVGLKSDGTVVSVGINDDGQCEVSGWTDIVAISTGGYHTVGLKSDGTLVAIGHNEAGQCNVHDWTNIISVSAGGYNTVVLKADGTVATVGSVYSGLYNIYSWRDIRVPNHPVNRSLSLEDTGKCINTISASRVHTVALKSDGTVIATGFNVNGQCDVSEWTDIISVSAGELHTAGLKSNGFVLTAGYNYYGQCNVIDWIGIIAVSASKYNTVGLKSDGTVVATGYNLHGQCDVSDWTDIVAISASNCHTVGLKADGTVVATGLNTDGQCNVSNWTDIIAVSASLYNTVGLKSDGTVVVVGGDHSGQCNTSDWTDIVAISAGMQHVVGLKSDGTVVTAGRGVSGQCDVSGWKDIVAISAGESHTVGVKSDGTVVAVGFNENGQCDVSDWTDMKVPVTSLRYEESKM